MFTLIHGSISRVILLALMVQKTFYLLKQCHELGAEDWKILELVLQNNNYFAHSENILLSGVCDNDDSVRHFCC